VIPPQNYSREIRRLDAADLSPVWAPDGIGAFAEGWGGLEMVRKFLKSWLSMLAGTAVLLVSSFSAQAFESIKMGDWDVSFSGNINGFWTSVDCDPNANGAVAGGLACGSMNTSSRDVGSIRTGLLPSWLGLNAKTTVGNINTEINIGFQPGIDGGAQSNELDGALQNNSENIRQVNVKFGGDWGTLMIGRDLGVFGSDAILADMTLLGVGTVSDLTAGGGNTSLGRIGVGYLYADWKAQVQYSSPNFGGFSFAVAIVDPWGMGALSSDSMNSSDFSQKSDTYGFEGKAAYSFGGDDSTVSGKVWAGFINQSLDSSGTVFASQDATGAEFGAKVSFSGLDLVGYFYSGDGIGTTGFLLDGMDLGGNTRDSDGFYAQATYAFPGPGTKVGLSFGESNLDLGFGDVAVGGSCEVLTAASCTLVQTNESFVAGLYHPLTPALNLVLEYTATESTAHNGNTAEETVIAIGAILFY